MTTYKNVTVKGPMASADWPKEIELAVNGVLNRAGTETVEMMRVHTRPHDWRGQLTDSIMWRTRLTRSIVPSGVPEIPAPKDGRTVSIGSKIRYAYFREYGAGVHTTKRGSAAFIARMRDWAEEKLGINSWGSPEDRSRFWAIIQTIRKGPKAQMGIQGKVPFMAPVEPYGPTILKRAGIDALRAMMMALRRKYR